jgi:hypothetical protein
MTMTGWALAATLALVSAGWGHGAAAFERSVTCGPPPNPFACEPGQTPAFVQWGQRCVTVYVNQSGSAEVSLAEFVRVTQASLDAWNAVDCADFTIAYGGTTREERVGYFPGERNANVLMFRDRNWAHGRGVLALTSVTYDVNTGRIVDADIEFNSQHYRYTTTDAAVLVEIDVMNTMVHEVGHFLGLDHSANPEATMFASAPVGETKKRSLHPDDEAGICEIYPRSGSDAACPSVSPGVFEPGHGGSDGGCAVVGPRRCRGGWSGAGLWAGLGVGLLVAVRARRRARALG